MSNIEKSTIQNLETDLVNSIKSNGLTELTFDYAEVIYDGILEEGVLKEIPIFGTLFKISKIGLGIREHFFAKKVLNFLLEIKDVTQKEREQFIKELEEDTSHGQKAGETLTVWIDRLDNLEKAKILGKLLKAKMQGKLGLNDFLRLVSIIDRGYLPDLKHLDTYFQGWSMDENVTFSLISLGLIYQSIFKDTAGEDEPIEKDTYKVTEIGRKLLWCKIL